MNVRVIQLIKMSLLPNHMDQIRRTIAKGSIHIDKQQWPFACFLMGHFWHKVNQIDLLSYFVQSIEVLSRKELINQKTYNHIVTTLEDYPLKIQQINFVLKQYRFGEIQHIDQKMNSFYPQSSKPSQRKESYPLEKDELFGTLNLQDIVPEMQGQKFDGTQELNNQQDIASENVNSEKDIELAKKMQEQFDKQAPPQDQQQYFCQICYCGLFDENVDGLDTCGHMFHSNCMTEAFKIKIMTNSFPLTCPKQQCNKQASEFDLKRILSKDLFIKYQDHTLKAYAQGHGDSISWCPTADCGYMFFFEKDDDERFQCLQCKKQYCLNCRVDWHKDMTCKEYKVSSTTTEDDEKFLKFVAGKKFKQCPKCKFWVQKNDGCDHMTCKCKFQFCYKCGGIYMKCECTLAAQKQQAARMAQMEQKRRAKEQRQKLMIEKRKQKEEAARQKQRLKEQKNEGRGTRSRRR